MGCSARRLGVDAQGWAFMTCKTASLPVSGRRAPGARVCSVGTWPLLVALCVLPIALSWGGASMADTRVAMSGRPPQNPVKIGSPRLSADGKLAALNVFFDEFLPRLVVFDIDREELMVLDRPANEGWLDPSFSPSGDRIAFIRYCTAGCAAGRKGFQVSILDRKSGTVTTVTEGSHLRRHNPLFSPSGRSVVFSSKDLVWKEEWLARGFKWKHKLPHTTLGGGNSSEGRPHDEDRTEDTARVVRGYTVFMDIPIGISGRRYHNLCSSCSCRTANE